MDSEIDFKITDIVRCFEIEKLIGGSNMKKLWLLLAMLTMFFAMGIVVQAGGQGEKEQSADLSALFDGELSKQGADVMKWLSEELAKEENKEKAGEVISFIKEKLEAGELESEEDISDAIQEGEEKFDVSLTEEEEEQILQAMQKIKDLGLDPEKLLDRVEKMYDDVGADLVEEAQETVKQSFADSVSGFFHDMGTRVKGFFANIFS